MTWTETLSSNRLLEEVRGYVEQAFKSVYPWKDDGGTVLFTLPDGSTMKVLAFSGNFNSLVMDYASDDDCDDGDMYYIDDYETPDAIFEAMLAETKR